MKKVIILWHNGGRLANQLWLYVSVYAYCIEKGYKLENHSFFEYAKYFKMKNSNIFIDFIFFKTFRFFEIIAPKKYSRSFIYRFRLLYNLYVNYIENKEGHLVVKSEDSIKNLPPTDNPSKEIVDFDSGNKKKIYLHGWLFRNSKGIIKHRSEITKRIAPKNSIQKRVDSFISPLRKKYSFLVGVHIRQGDYKDTSFKKFYFSPEKVAVILKEYQRHKKTKNICFIICSDEHVDLSVFHDLNLEVELGPGKITEDLFTLASTDLIIGSDSTFGSFASYYGNIPQIVFEEKVNWSEYDGYSNFFENQKCILTRFLNKKPKLLKEKN